MLTCETSKGNNVQICNLDKLESYFKHKDSLWHHHTNTHSQAISNGVFDTTG